jgi:hypothetical protein
MAFSSKQKRSTTGSLQYADGDTFAAKHGQYGAHEEKDITDDII